MYYNIKQHIYITEMSLSFEEKWNCDIKLGTKGRHLIEISYFTYTM